MNFNVIFVFFTLVGVVFSQNEDATLTLNTASADEIIRQTGICKNCTCVGQIVNCSAVGLTTFYSESDWAETGITNSEILDIDFSRNPLKILNVVPDLPIYQLNLSRCELGEIEGGAFRNLEELEILDLSWNQLSTAAVSKNIFGGTFEPGKGRPSFVNMRNLSLAYNEIHALPKDIFMFMTGLRALDLSGNPLTAIDQVTMVALSDLKLTDLSLASCELESLPDGLLRRQRRLRRLDLSDNRFTTVPAVLSEASASLVYLNFNKNSLTSLTEMTAISNLTKLQELHLCRNSRLQIISAGALGGLESLTVLHVTHNPRLCVIEPGFLAWEDEHGNEVTPRLQQLYLNNNNISSISYHYLDRWNELTRADFSNNPYVCNSTNQWMVDVLVPLLEKINCSADNMICKKPPDMGGLSFETLRQTNRTLISLDMQEIDTNPGPDVAILLGVMIGIFATFPIVLIVVLLWKNGYFERCRRKISSDRVSYYDEDDGL